MTNYFDVQSNYTSGVTCDIWVRPSEVYCTTTDPLLWKMVVNNQALTNGHRTFAVPGDMHVAAFWCPAIQGAYVNPIVKVILRHGSDEWTSPEYVPNSYNYAGLIEYTMNSTPNNPRGSTGMYLPITDPTGTVVHDFPIIPPPVANFTHSPPMPYYPNLTNTFTNTTTGTQPITYLWNFGDGLTSTEVSPVHTYSSPGYHLVTLTATNEGGSSIKTHDVEIGVDLPDVGFNKSVTSGYAPLSVSFTADIWEDLPGWYSYTYEWDFGDTTLSTEQNPVHVYVSEGNYTVTLRLRGTNWATQYVSTTPIQVVTPECPATCPADYHCDGASTNYECVPDAGLQCPTSCPDGYYCAGAVTNYECVLISDPDPINWVGIGVGAAVLGYLLISGNGKPKEPEVK